MNLLTSDINPPWRPTASIEVLRRRGELTWRLRQFFHQRDILEVHTPTLCHDTVVDRHIEPIALPGKALGLAELADDTLFLQTSPEFCMKRLVAAGMPAIYQIGPVYRGGESGNFHNPEFTMVEWYRVGDNLTQAVQLLSELVVAALGVSPPHQQTYQAAFQQYAQLDPLACPISELARCAVDRNLGVGLDWSQDRDDWLNLIFSDVIQPQLGHNLPTIITHYPASQSALARLSSQDARTAERFELFIHGIELANGYNELTDASELVHRNQTTNRQRLDDGHRALPEQSYLIDAMQATFPACSGCALGLDRLLMVAEGITDIDRVISFPISRA
ncbi:EF-P lysine aminoacylase EpmA [Aureliella helgolandensis]|uniref:Elongation factor P--(R)-beta-lysine ligase n=1 Tax=Aureliella helgolandensis TaxID=2527968 RepID=A0A518G071_9BACT|nr:EF-P lysine aminoacylase EpmA [Aureliella helgolandensis]QDV21966.1 Elongation factor P--(R)-beta-lysine ligase [Aureliella helgolandensis]